MDIPRSLDTLTPAAELRRKPRAVVFGSGIGMFPPLMSRFQEEFEIVATLSPRISPFHEWWYRLISIRLPRIAWYRKWRYHLEKTPAAFRLRTRASARQLEALDGQYDVILFLGAAFAPGAGKDKPLFVFTDSCRWLSANNAHDEISHFHSTQDQAQWFALEGEVYQSAAHIFVGSHFVRNALISHYGVSPHKVAVSGFGAGIGFGEPYAKTFDGKTILYIGKGDFEKKGGMVLLKAFEKVRGQLPDAQLQIVGQERVPAAPGVVNLGFIADRRRLVGLMRNAHVFTLPSLVDRFGIALVEAMAAATPCVASDYGAMPEVVAEAGIVVPSGDVDALANALLKVLRAPDLARELGERGRRRFEKIYNWGSVWQVVRNGMQQVL